MLSLEDSQVEVNEEETAVPVRVHDVQLDARNITDNSDLQKAEEEDLNVPASTTSENRTQEIRHTNNTVFEENHLTKHEIQQRGKYLRPCPDIKDIHNKQLIKRNNLLLINGNKWPVQKIEDTVIAVRNTCPYDSLVEVLSHAYVENQTYREETQKFTG